MQMVKFPVRTAIERVLINALTMSGGGRYWGRGTLDTDENDQLKCQKCPRKARTGQAGTERRAESFARRHLQTRR